MFALAGQTTALAGQLCWLAALGPGVGAATL